jgi:hypothetical protein
VVKKKSAKRKKVDKIGESGVFDKLDNNDKCVAIDEFDILVLMCLLFVCLFVETATPSAVADARVSALCVSGGFVTSIMMLIKRQLLLRLTLSTNKTQRPQRMYLCNGNGASSSQKRIV